MYFPSLSCNKLRVSLSIGLWNNFFPHSLSWDHVGVVPGFVFLTSNHSPLLIKNPAKQILGQKKTDGLTMLDLLFQQSVGGVDLALTKGQ